MPGCRRPESLRAAEAVPIGSRIEGAFGPRQPRVRGPVDGSRTTGEVTGNLHESGCWDNSTAYVQSMPANSAPPHPPGSRHRRPRRRADRPRTRMFLLGVIVAALTAGCTATGEGVGATNSASPPASTATSGAPAQPAGGPASPTPLVSAPVSDRSPASFPASATGSVDPAEAAAVLGVVRDGMTTGHLRSVIVRVTRNGENVVTAALGESMTGVPATVDMHFRNGAVAISYVATALLQLVDDGTVSLEERVSTWLPDLPHSGEVTLGQLAQMTSGYHDYVQQPAFIDALQADPYRQWTPQQLLTFVAAEPLFYRPGTNWNYSHTNYVILGLALEKITGQPVNELLQDKILGPLKLDNTVDPGTPAIEEPVLHAFTAERRGFFDIAAKAPFYEESTFWNPSWTITRGAIQTTNIYDMTATAVAVGEGTLLSEKSHDAQVSTGLRGFGAPLEGCATCFQQSEGYSYGIGVVTSGNWTLQNPMFSGAAAAEGYLPSQKLAVAVAVTFAPEAFDSEGNYSNEADALWRRIGARIAPDDPPPIKN